MLDGQQSGQDGKDVAWVGQILDEIIGSRIPGRWPVSLALTALKTRRMAPDCGLSDEDLAQMIATRAVERGRDVIFDADLLSGNSV